MAMVYCTENMTNFQSKKKECESRLMNFYLVIKYDVE